MTMKQLDQYRRNMAALDDSKRYRDETTKNERLARLVIYAVALALAILAVASICTAHERKPRYMRVLVTAYCKGPCAICQTTGITATGKDASRRGVAVDPSVIALGARLDVPGRGVWLPADDVGGAIKGNHIDVRFNDHATAATWGRRWLRVRVWE